MAQKKWEEIYEKYDIVDEVPHPSFEKLVNLLLAHSTKKVLDLGCGAGRHLLPLAKAGFQVEGIDYSTNAIELVSEIAKQEKLEDKINLSAGDIHKVIEFFEPESFDAVLCFNSMQYTSEEGFTNTLQLINQLLKTKGILYLTVPSTQTQAEAETGIEQLKFTKELILEHIEQKFRLLDFSVDDEHNFIITAYEK